MEKMNINSDMIMFLSVENILLDVQNPHRGNNDCYPYKVVPGIIS